MSPSFLLSSLRCQPAGFVEVRADFGASKRFWTNMEGEHFLRDLRGLRQVSMRYHTAIAASLSVRFQALLIRCGHERNGDAW